MTTAYLPLESSMPKRKKKPRKPKRKSAHQTSYSTRRSPEDFQEQVKQRQFQLEFAALDPIMDQLQERLYTETLPEDDAAVLDWIGADVVARFVRALGLVGTSEAESKQSLIETMRETARAIGSLSSPSGPPAL